MKNINKIMAMALSAMLAVGGMGISAMAEEVIDLGHGITLTIRSEEEEMQRPMPHAWDTFQFDQYIGEYPEPFWLENDMDDKRTYMPLGIDESNIQIRFTKGAGNELYTALYDVTEGRDVFYDCYNGLVGPDRVDATWELSGLTGGHTYRVGFASVSGQVHIAGSVKSY